MGPAGSMWWGRRSRPTVLGEDLLVVLPGSRARRGSLRWAQRQPERHARLDGAAHLGIFDDDGHVVGDDLWVPENLPGRENLGHLTQVLVHALDDFFALSG